jgi:hypothetical protein
MLKCDSAFNWNKSKSDFSRMLYDVEKFASRFNTDELKFYEGKRYDEAYQSYRTRDAKHIDDCEKFVSHRFHLQYPEVCADAMKTCDLCITKLRCEREREIYETAYLKKISEGENRWNIEQAEKQKEERERSRRDSRNYHCVECDFHTTSMDAYEVHTDSREHKSCMNRQQWNCSACKVQSRSNTEHEFHLTTKKHRLAMGEGSDTEEFKCDPCGISTPYKQVYERHCKSTKHAKACV